MVSKIERAPQQLATATATATSTSASQSRPAVQKAAAETVSTASASQAVSQEKLNSALATFSEGGAAQATRLDAPAQHVATSADPGALWGQSAPKAGASPELDAFRALPPAQQRAKLQELRADRNQLTGAIQERVEQLDVRWNRMQNKTRARALGEYQGKSAHLDPKTRQEVEVLLVAAAAAQAKIDALTAEAKALPKDSKVTQPERRSELARELRRQRAELAAVVAQATNVVDTKGLKVDRLATTETTIDPTAAKQPESQSLSGMVKSWFQLDWLIGKAAVIVGDAITQWQLQRHGEQARDDIRQSDLDQKQTQARRLMEEVLTNYRNVAQGIEAQKAR